MNVIDKESGFPKRSFGLRRYSQGSRIARNRETWYRIGFLKRETDDGSARRFEQAASQIIAYKGASATATLYVRDISGSSHTQYFFNPEAYELCSKLVTQFNGQACERPSRVGLRIIFPKRGSFTDDLEEGVESASGVPTMNSPRE